MAEAKNRTSSSNGTESPPQSPSRTHFQAVFQTDRLYLWLLTPDGVLVEANRAALDLARLERDAVVWHHLWETPWWVDSEARASLAQAAGLAAAGETVRFETELHCADGGAVAVDLTVRPNFDALGKVTLLIAEARDLSDIRRADARLRRARERFETLFGGVPSGAVLLTAELAPLALNAAARTLLQVAEGDLDWNLLGRWQALDESHEPLSLERHPAVRALRRRAPQLEQIVGLPNGDATRWFKLDAYPLRDARVPGGAAELTAGDDDAAALLLIFRDISDQRRHEALLRHRAQHDPLTELPNRAAFFAALAECSAGSEPFGVMHLDVDDFKHINDSFGHARADRFLQNFAERLARCLRPHDFVARIAGDEFAVLLRNLPDESAAVKVAARVLQQVRRPVPIDTDVVSSSTSLGIALAQPGIDPETAMRNADFALRHAKVGGRDRYAIYNEELSEEHAAEARLAADLKLALERGQLDIFYQPLVDVKDRQVVGAEALMRWRHPERGMVSPVVFIPIAERTGLIVPMENWLVDVALAQLKLWNLQRPDFRLSMNLSARQLEQKNFLGNFEASLRASGVNPRNVQLEVTETYAMQRPAEKGSLLRALTDLGVTLAIDDFGTGYSNLGHLQHLPFEVVKIDRSFMRDVPEDQRNFALVRTIIAMAQSLDLEVVAEGVETRTQADFLYWEGAALLQGFLFGKPIPAGEFERAHFSDDPSETSSEN